VKEIDRKQGVQSESAILVGVELPNTQAGRDNLAELAGLVETAGAEIVGRLTQKRQVPDQTTYLGKGKVEQLELMVRATDADAVVFDNNLSAAQVRNLERELGVKVLDRTEVILDIFSTRARTHEARLAIAALEADVDALVADQGRRGHARAWRKAVGNRPPFG
jgi:GTPase